LVSVEDGGHPGPDVGPSRQGPFHGVPDATGPGGRPRDEARREPDEIDPDTPLFGVGLALDSIDAVDLLVQLSAEFGIDVRDDEEGRVALRTVNSLVDLALAAEARRADD